MSDESESASLHIHQGVVSTENAKEATPTLKHYYTNQIRALTLPWDITLLLSSIRPVGSGSEMDRVDLCQVTMSPTMAATLVVLLKKQLATYEKKYGTIPVPKEIVEDQ